MRPVHQPQQPLFGRAEAPQHDTYTPSNENGQALTDAKGQPITREYRINGLLPTNERLPVKTGGLGEVCFTITKAMAKFGTPKEMLGKAPPRDLRVVVPYLQTNRLQDDKFKALEKKELAQSLSDSERKELKSLREDYGQPFKPTNAVIQAKIKDKTYDFQVLQAFEPAYNKDGSIKTDPNSKNEGNQVGTWVYALKNDALFSNTGNIATYEAMSKSSLELLTPFNEAVGKLVPYLEGREALPAKKGEEEDLKTFDQRNDGGKLGFMVGNDWLTGPSLYQDKDVRARKDIHKIFFMHNSYDSGAIPAKEAVYDRGWPIPTTLTKPDDVFSQLTLSLMSADAIAANKNFVKTLTQTDFGKGQAYVAALRHHLENGTIFDMHHGLDENFRPDINEFLQATNDTEYQGEDDKETKQRDHIKSLTGDRVYQFEELDKRALAEDTPDQKKLELWKTFKDQNKAALQRKYGLKEDKDAVVMNWAARLEPNQKGFYLVQHTIEQLLKDNPKLQILIAGNVGDPKKYGPNEQKIADWIKKVTTDPAYKGRVYIPNAFVSKREITQMNAGSDFTILPSLYEPYGLTQLEAIMMGSIPLVNGVDGLRTTVSDPDIRKKEKYFDFIGDADDVKEKVWKYFQTGIMLGNIHAPEYRAAIMRQQDFRILEDKIRNAQFGALEKNEKTKEDFKKLREALIENAPRISDETQKKEIANLVARLGKPEAYLREKDFKVWQYIEAVDKDKYIHPAEKKFAAAMQEAITLAGDPKKLAEVRANGFRFLKEQHKWEEIINSRYHPMLDHSFKANPSQKRGMDINFTNTPPFPREVSALKTGKPPEDPKGFLNKTWANFKAALATIIYYLNVFNWFKKAGVKQAEEKDAQAAS